MFLSETWGWQGEQDPWKAIEPWHHRTLIKLKPVFRRNYYQNKKKDKFWTAYQYYYKYIYTFWK